MTSRSKTLPVFHLNRSVKGFTLVEILIAVFILGIVMTTVFGSFSSIFKSTDHIKNHTSVHESARICMDRISSDLSALHISFRPAYDKPGLNDDQEKDIYFFEGKTAWLDGETFPVLTFSTHEHLGFGTDETDQIGRIVYYVRKTDDRGFVLSRSDTVFPYPDVDVETARDPVLCENLKKISFIYYDEDGKTFETWDSESEDFHYATPSAVGITLEIASSGYPVLFETTVPLNVHREKKE